MAFEKALKTLEYNKIIDMLQLLGNCSNTSAYEYTQQDVDKIFSFEEVKLLDSMSNEIDDSLQEEE